MALTLDLRSLLTVSECITRAALERKESRGAQTRDDYPASDEEYGRKTVVVRERAGALTVSAETIARNAGRRAPAIGGRVMAEAVTLRLWRGDSTEGGLRDYTTNAEEGEVVLDVILRIQATEANDLAVRWNCKAGKCGSCSAEVNGRPRLLCMTRMNLFAPNEAITVTPMRAFPIIRDLVTDVSFNYEMARRVPAFSPRPREPRRHVSDAADRHRPGSGVPQVHRVFFVPGRLSRHP